MRLTVKQVEEKVAQCAVNVGKLGGIAAAMKCIARAVQKEVEKQGDFLLAEDIASDLEQLEERERANVVALRHRLTIGGIPDGRG